MIDNSPINPELLPYSAARREIRNADLLLFRSKANPVAIAGRGLHHHAAMAGWWGLDLFALETTSFYGGRIVLLSRYVNNYRGHIDVFKANPDDRWPNFNRREAVHVMRRLAGARYGWLGILQALAIRTPVVRLFFRPSIDDLATTNRPPFCSWAVSAATRIGGGIDPVPSLADHFTEPADLARSPFYRYRFTIGPSKG